MYPSIKLMNNFKNSLQELGFRKKVKYINSIRSSINTPLDCKTVGFFLKISKEIGKARRKSLTRAKRSARAPRQTFYLTARAYLNTQKYGLFCSLTR